MLFYIGDADDYDNVFAMYADYDDDDDDHDEDEYGNYKDDGAPDYDVDDAADDGGYDGVCIKMVIPIPWGVF